VFNKKVKTFEKYSIAMNSTSAMGDGKVLFDQVYVFVECLIIVCLSEGGGKEHCGTEKNCGWD
jgi:hypothetical protein